MSAQTPSATAFNKYQAELSCPMLFETVDDVQLLHSHIIKSQNHDYVQHSLESTVLATTGAWKTLAFISVAFAISAFAFPILGILGATVFAVLAYGARESSLLSYNIVDLSKKTTEAGKALNDDTTIDDFLNSVYKGTFILKFITKHYIEKDMAQNDSCSLTLQSKVSELHQPKTA